MGARVDDSDVPGRHVPVWGVFVRAFHWLVVAGFLIAYASDDDLLTLHVWAGYVVGVLVILRIVWGFVGPTRARFSDFLCSPWRAWRYLLDLIAFRAPRHVGHSPAGGWMVVALLVGLLAVVWSGLELHAIENGAGPLAGTVRPLPADGTSLDNSATSRVTSATIGGGREEDRDTGSATLWEALHEGFANAVMALVFVHVFGVALACVVHRENLVSAMVSGTKRVR